MKREQGEELCPAPTGAHSFQVLILVPDNQNSGPILAAVCSYCLTVRMGHIEKGCWVWSSPDVEHLGKEKS